MPGQPVPGSAPGQSSPSATLLAGMEAYANRRISRRAFLRFCGAMAALLALPKTFEPRIAAAVSNAGRVPLVWLRGQGCGGNSEAFLRSANPGIAEVLLGTLSVDYLETLMAASGSDAGDALATVRSQFPGGYIAIVEGAVSTGADGIYHTVGGRAFSDVVKEVCDGARATIAVGSCAFDGGLARADGATTDSSGVVQVVANPKFVALPGCPMNVANLAATIVHFLTFEGLPAADARGRPLFAYGALLHNLCERRPHFEFGEFVREWGDEGAQKGWCLYKMGCKGPEVFANCATVRYDEGTTWPVQAGHGCIGCVMPDFWDSMGTAYDRLPGWVPFNPEITADDAGVALVGGIAAVATLHGGASIVRSKRAAAAKRRPRVPQAIPEAIPAEAAIAVTPALSVADAAPVAPTVSEPAVAEPQPTHAPIDEAPLDVAPLDEAPVAVGPVPPAMPNEPAEPAPDPDTTEEA